MSWTPDLWIKKEDFAKHEERLKEYNVWEFNIAGIEGYVISYDEESSSVYREIHDIIQDVPHWILDSHCGRCDNCNEWGNQIYDSYCY